jgi:hypothetical protein
VIDLTKTLNRAVHNVTWESTESSHYQLVELEDAYTFPERATINTTEGKFIAISDKKNMYICLVSLVMFLKE